MITGEYTLNSKREKMNKKLNININVIYYAVLILILITGTVYRTSVWINEPGFFGDEGALIHNIQTKTYLGLFTTLDKAQCCPSLFLFFNKFIYSIFGLNEQALRFIPYFSGILSIIFAPLFCKKVFNSKFITLIFTSLLIYNPNAVYYSQEFKQYSSDILLTMAAIYLFFAFKDKVKNIKSAITTGILSGISVFFSYSVQFVVFPMLMFFMAEFVKKKENKTALFTFFPYFLILFVCFITTVFGTFFNGILEAWIDEPFLVKNLSDFIHLNSYLTLNIPFESFTAILFLSGTVLLAVKNRLLLYILIMPVLLNIISGVVNLYPFATGRVTLYLIPVFTVIILFPFDYLLSKIKKTAKNELVVIFTCILCFFFFQSQKPDYINGYKYYYIRSNAREYVKLLNKRNIDKNDIIFADTNAEGIFEIYDTEKKYINNRILYMKFHEPLKVIEYSEGIYHIDKIKKGEKIYFYNTELYPDAVDVTVLRDWIQKNCKVLYKEKDSIGEFLYVKKIK